MTLRVGIAGLGTVGAGVLRLLSQNRDLIAARAGTSLAVTAISARDRTRDRGFSLADLHWHDDPTTLATAPDIDVVVELIGGAEGPARTLVEAALAAGRPVVTANKALIAVHGAALAELAASRNTTLAFEAAVAGGIPVIKALREGFAANAISRIEGILNGTCNYILTAMSDHGQEFSAVLAQAQSLGYAEADPATDIDGIDTAHKLTILTALAFGRPVQFSSVHVEGIRAISAYDIAYASELGYRIKLLGIARRVEAGIEARVHPCLVKKTDPIARVDGVFNAVVVHGDFVGRVMLEGRGAGAGPTASAVVADLIDIARGRTTPIWGVAETDLLHLPNVPMSAHVGPYYLRLSVIDRPGVIADVAAVLRDQGISLESMLQRGRSEGEAVPIVLVTHTTTEAAMQAALAHIARLDAVLEPPALIRIEPE
jgi:homoserine dehydrogenase